MQEKMLGSVAHKQCGYDTPECQPLHTEILNGMALQYLHFSPVSPVSLPPWHAAERAAAAAPLSLLQVIVIACCDIHLETSVLSAGGCCLEQM